MFGILIIMFKSVCSSFSPDPVGALQGAEVYMSVFKIIETIVIKRHWDSSGFDF